MMEFGLEQKKQGGEVTRKMMVVNLAIAMKFDGDEAGAMKILRDEDWSATGDKFHICVAAVMNDVDRVVDLMQNISDKDIDKDEFRDWPAFRWVGTEQKFVQAFEKKFGEPFIVDQDSQDVSKVPPAGGIAFNPDEDSPDSPAEKLEIPGTVDKRK